MVGVLIISFSAEVVVGEGVIHQEVAVLEDLSLEQKASQQQLSL